MLALFKIEGLAYWPEKILSKFYRYAVKIVEKP